MPLISLAAVTDALRTLVSEGIAESSAWKPNPAPAVEPVPPEVMTAEGLTLYLYGVGENPTAANRPGRTRDLPLGLDLHYQLVAHGAVNPTTASMQREHLLLGLAMKVLHDHPRLEAGITVNGVDVLGSVGLDDGNTMSITLHKLEPEQAITWWTASQSGVHAAAYYTVAVALLQEQPQPVSGPPVLTPEVFGFAALGPHLSSSSSRHTITPPGGAATPMRSTPAQVVPGEPFELTGAGFTGELAVTVRQEGWADFAALSGASVQTAHGVERLSTALDERVSGRLVVPGVLRVRVTRSVDRTLNGGETRRFDLDSNETAISVLPGVDSVTVGATVLVTGGPFEAPGIDPADVRVAVGSDELARVTAAPAPGQFRILDRSRIQFRPTTPATSGEPVRVRVIVNGAECLPVWYVAP